MDAYIISWFGKSAELRLKRQGLHYRQLCCLLKQPGIENIHILAMEYEDQRIITLPKDHLYFDHPRIHYHISERVHPGQARNKLMKVFNKTDKKWGLFMDNDAAIDPRFHGTDLITTIDANADYIAKRMEIITFVSPRHEPFTEYLETSAERLKTHLPLQKANFLKTTAFLMKNRSAFGQEPVYFDDELDNMEDYEYIGRILAAGGAMYKARSAIMADLGISETVSTLFTAGQEESRLSTYPVKRKILFDRYQPHGLTQSANGNFNWSEIGNNKTLPKYFYVPVNGVGEPIEENTFGALFEA
jgi:hypothetical protein